NKLIGGNFRIGVSQAMIVNALAKVYAIEAQALTHRISGQWTPDTITFDELLTGEHVRTDASKPYPFYLAYAVEGPDLPGLGDPGDWQVEWKWDGIRAQVIKRKDEVFAWSRGEDLITERFPEISAAAATLPNGTVLDGEVLPWIDGKVLPFTELQKRIGRKNVSAKILAEVPVVLECYDLLEYEGQDIRSVEFKTRREFLENIIEGLEEDARKYIRLTPVVEAGNWKDLAVIREQSRFLGVEGFMLKRRESPYRTGRHRGDWWKWKIDPLTIDAVLIYAQKGTGKRSNLFTDYTFAVWKDDVLVPFAKAYSGLTDVEIRKVDRYVRDNTVETFGPVRSVTPKLVFEIAFEALQRSSRHKSGVAVRFPRISRWRDDKTIEQADSLDTIYTMLDAYQNPGK
ncbi:MAG: ATP-dependent DNA ligase, partial [Saprospiraceae bacterium]|nr:ATP-dependent DNA ligase [Pyrinomonadaceae bacterium]